MWIQSGGREGNVIAVSWYYEEWTGWHGILAVSLGGMYTVIVLIWLNSHNNCQYISIRTTHVLFLPLRRAFYRAANNVSRLNEDFISSPAYLLSVFICLYQGVKYFLSEAFFFQEPTVSIVTQWRCNAVIKIFTLCGSRAQCTVLAHGTEEGNTGEMTHLNLVPHCSVIHYGEFY